MDLNELMRNIRGIDKEKVLKETIDEVRNEFTNIVEKQRCKIYSGRLVEKLKEKHVPVRLVNTKDLGYPYEHEFVLVPDKDDSYFLSDLTYSQFNALKFPDLLEFGYERIDSDVLNDYLGIVTGVNSDKNIDDIYYLENGKKSK